MEIRTLRYFLAAAREENMSRAAEQLHVTQPTLSKAMKALEEELGRKLFTRRSFSIRLTDEGALLRDLAEDLVSMADRITQSFAALDDITGGDICLGLAESYQIGTLARAIREFREQYPGLRYHITSGDTEQVTEKLDRGLLDFSVLAEPPDASRYDWLVFPRGDVWGLVFRADDPLAEKGSVTADDLVGLPLFCSEQSWRSDIPRWCGERMKDLRLEGSFRLSYNGSVFAREGLGYLLTFDRLIDTSPGSGLVFRPLSPKLENRLYLIWKKYRTLSPIAERFLDRLQSSFGRQIP